MSPATEVLWPPSCQGCLLKAPLLISNPGVADLENVANIKWRLCPYHLMKMSVMSLKGSMVLPVLDISSLSTFKCSCWLSTAPAVESILFPLGFALVPLSRTHIWDHDCRRTWEPWGAEPCPSLKNAPATLLCPGVNSAPDLRTYSVPSGEACHSSDHA